MADQFEALKAEIEAAAARLEKAQEGHHQNAALADLEAAKRTLRSARRAAGEYLVPEDHRDVPVTMGMLEELMFPIRDRIGSLERKVRGHSPTPGPAKRVKGKGK